MAHICPFGKSVISYSEDNGETYTTAAPVIDTILDDRDSGIVTFGEKFKAPVTSPHGPTILKDGTILWVGADITDQLDNKGISVYRLSTDGKTKFVGEIDDVYENGNKLFFCEPYAIETDDGTIICHIRTHCENNFTTIYQSESKDGGKSWSKPHRLPIQGGAPAHLIKHSSGAIISSYGFRGIPEGIRIMISYDNGMTWDVDNVLLETHTGWDLGYPCTTELSDGSLLTVFYAHTEQNNGGPAVIMQQKWKLNDINKAQIVSKS